MSEERTLLITTHQVDEIEFMLTDIMFMKDGAIVLDAPTDVVRERYRQVILGKDRVAEGAALGPIYSETRFGQTVMVFDGVPADRLQQLGDVSTPTISDLFVALMQRESAIPGDR